MSAVRSTVAHLHCDFVLPGPRGDQAPVRRLEEAVRGPVAAELEAALDRVLGAGGAVYLVREVHAPVLLDWPAGAGTGVDPASARDWARQLAAAVGRTVQAGGPNVAHFPDQAGYLARFLADALAGQARAHWYYAALGPVRDLPLAEATAAVLADAPDRAGLLAALHAAGVLPAVLAALPDHAVGELAGGLLGDDRELAALVRTAVAVATRLGLWSGAPWPLDRVLAAYRPARAADWRSRQGLTAVVLDVLGQLAGHGALRPAGEVPAAALSGLSWLDTTALTRGLVALPAAADPGSPTARQRALFEAIRTVLPAAGGAPGPAAALRLHAALVASHPRWSADELAAATVRLLVGRWRAAATGTVTDLGRLPGDDLVTALVELAGQHLSGAIRTVLPAGPAGLHSALVARYPEWSGDPLAAATVRRLVDRARQLAAGPVSDAGRLPGDDLAAALATQDAARTPSNGAPPNPADANPGGADQGGDDPAGAGSGGADPGGAHPGGVDPAAGRPLEVGAAGGHPADAGPAAAAPAPGGPGGSGQRLWWSRQAGVLLLLRAVQDLRLTSVLHRTFGPDPDLTAAALLAAARYLTSPPEAGSLDASALAAGPPAAGRPEASPAGEPVDPAVAAFAGLLEVADIPARAAQLRAHWDSRPRPAHATFRRALRAVLASNVFPPANPSPDPTPGPAMDAAGRPADDLADRSARLLARALLRSWARWLGGFASSTEPFLLEQFVRRPGMLALTEEQLTVTLEPRSLDVVLDRAGYLAPLRAVRLLAGRDLVIRVAA